MRRSLKSSRGDESESLLGICTTKDVDMVLNHMNNARYFREVDLARIDFYIRSRLYDVVRSQSGQILLGACNVRFRKFIGVFSRFKITTKICYWNDDSIFIEHKFIGNDGFVHATLLCQQRLVNCNGETVMDILLKQGSTILSKPEMPMTVITRFRFPPRPNCLFKHHSGCEIYRTSRGVQEEFEQQQRRLVETQFKFPCKQSNHA
jgi:acyl-CoA thioesterase FadM